MDLKTLYTALSTTGLEVFYSNFEETDISAPHDPPYIAYLFSFSSDFMADNVNYKNIDNVQVELYTDKKDLASEKLVEDVLKANELTYFKTETRIDSEMMYQVIYEIQLI